MEKGTLLITTKLKEIKWILQEDYEQLYANELENLDEMVNFQKDLSLLSLLCLDIFGCQGQ